MQTYEEIMQSMKKGEFASIYLLCGTEPYYSDLVCNWCENNIIAPNAISTDRTIIYADDMEKKDIAYIVNMARNFPMLGQKKLIILKDAQKIKNWEAMDYYEKNPSKRTILILCFRETVPDKRLTVWKNFEKAGNIWMQADKLKYEGKIETWTRNYLIDRINKYNKEHSEKKPITLDQKVPQMLATYIGDDLQGIANACEKLIMGLPDNKFVIDTAMVERNIGFSKDFNVFELQDALFEKDITKVNRIIKHFSSSKDHVMQKELIVLYNAFANLMIYHYLPDKSERSVASNLGINPYFVNKFKKAATLYSARKTFNIIGYFREIDAKSKGIGGGNVSEGDLWKELVFKILY